MLHVGNKKAHGRYVDDLDNDEMFVHRPRARRL